MAAVFGNGIDYLGEPPGCQEEAPLILVAVSSKRKKRFSKSGPLEIRTASSRAPDCTYLSPQQVSLKQTQSPGR